MYFITTFTNGHIKVSSTTDKDELTVFLTKLSETIDLEFVTLEQLNASNFSWATNKILVVEGTPLTPKIKTVISYDKI